MKQYEIKEFIDKLSLVFQEVIKQLVRIKVVMDYMTKIVADVDARQKAALDEMGSLFCFFVVVVFTKCQLTNKPLHPPPPTCKPT